jgi:type IV secretion system protein TrbL
LISAVGPADEFCKLVPSNPACAANDAVNGAIETVGTAVDFATDPFGYLGDKLAEACRGIVDTVIPALIGAAQPDLSADFFVDAYKISWGLSFFLLVFVLFANFLALGRGKASTADVAETLTIYLPAWALGVLAGPALGQLLIGLVWDLVNDLWNWPGFGAGTNMKGTGEKLGEYISGGPGNTIPGGDIVFIVVLTFMLLALLMIVVVMLVMSVTLYFSGALLPLTLIWVMKPGSRSKGLKVLYVWVGILFAIPVMFFGLGLAFSMVNAGFQLTGKSSPENAGVQNLINLLLAVVVISMVAFSPAKITKMLGDAAPDDSGNADKPSSDDAGGGGGGSRIAQLSQQQASASQPGGSGSREPVSVGAGSSGGSSAMEPVRASDSGRGGTPGGSGSGRSGGSAAGGGRVAAGSKAASATPAGMPVQVLTAAAKVGTAAVKTGQQAGSQTAQMSQRSAADSAARSSIDKPGHH